MSSANATLRRMRFDEVLRTFGEFFEREGVRWARPTGDIDFIIDRVARAKVIKFAKSAGYEVHDASEGVSMHHNSAPGTLNVLYVHRETADAVFAATRRFTTRAFSVPLLDRDSVAILKSLRTRNRPNALIDWVLSHVTPSERIEIEKIEAVAELADFELDDYLDFLSSIAIAAPFSDESPSPEPFEL